MAERGDQIVKLLNSVSNLHDIFDPWYFRDSMSEDMEKRWMTVQALTFTNFLVALTDTEFEDYRQRTAAMVEQCHKHDEEFKSKLGDIKELLQQYKAKIQDEQDRDNVDKE